MHKTVTAEDIADIPAGTVFQLEPGSVVTPLAADFAREKNIRFEYSREGRREEVLALGADHGGYTAKEAVKKHLEGRGFRVVDFGVFSDSPSDYPDQARKVAEAVASGRCRLGIMIDAAGIGSCMAANKVPGVLAALCYDEATAHNSREHNYANVLTLGARMLPIERLLEIVDVWLQTGEGEGRHGRRVQKIRDIELQYLRRL